MSAEELCHIKTLSHVYTFPGSHPHQPGTVLRLPREHAQALVDDGHATHHDPDAAKDAPADTTPAEHDDDKPTDPTPAEAA